MTAPTPSSTPSSTPATKTAPLAHLHLLTVLAQTRSFTLAARRLGMSKSSASTHVSDLERAAGVPLVRRTTRSVLLTEAGQLLVQATQANFLQIEQAFAGVRDLAGQPQGLVRVTAPVALGRQHVAPLLAGYLQAHPGVRVELDLNDRLVNLSQEGFDLAVRHAQAAPDTHVAWLLCETRALLVASPDYVQRRGLPAHPKALADHDCLAYLRTGSSPRWAFERTRGRRPTQPVSVAVRGPFQVNNSEVLRDAVEAGLGIAMLPDFSARAALRAGRLVPLLPDWKPVGSFGERLYATRAWSAQVPRAVQRLVDHLRAGFAGGWP